MYLKKISCWPHTVLPIKHLPGYTRPYSQTPCISKTNTYNIPEKPSILIKDHPRLSSPLSLAPYPILARRQAELCNRARDDLIRQHQRNKWHDTHSSLPKEVRLHFSQLVLSTYDNHIGWTGSKGRHDSRIPARSRSGLEQDLQHRRLITLLFVVGAFMQACVLTTQNYKDEFLAEDVSSQGGGRLIESRRRRASCLGFGDAQVERFLLKRDPSGEGVTGSERMVYREALPYCSYGG